MALTIYYTSVTMSTSKNILMGQDKSKDIDCVFTDCSLVSLTAYRTPYLVHNNLFSSRIFCCLSVCMAWSSCNSDTCEDNLFNYKTKEKQIYDTINYINIRFSQHILDLIFL